MIGVEWWFSVTLTNSTPQWLLPCHFDRSDLDEQDLQKIRHPETASVLFLTSVPYGELVVTDQVLTDKGAHPQQPKDMRFVSPKANRYATFPGHLYHGVIGRMWRPAEGYEAAHHDGRELVDREAGSRLPQRLTRMHDRVAIEGVIWARAQSERV